MPYCLASLSRRRATGSDAMRARFASDTFFGFEIMLELLFVGDFVGFTIVDFVGFTIVDFVGFTIVDFVGFTIGDVWTVGDIGVGDIGVGDIGVGDIGVGDIGVGDIGTGLVTNSADSSSIGKSLHSCPTFSFQKPMTVFETGQMHALSRWRRKQLLLSMKNRQQFGGGV
jgi:hypothetical protein